MVMLVGVNQRGFSTRYPFSHKYSVCVGECAAKLEVRLAIAPSAYLKIILMLSSDPVGLKSAKVFTVVGTPNEVSAANTW